MHKTKYIIAFVLILTTHYFTQQQQPEKWLQYTCGINVLSIAEEGNFLWIGTEGGLVKMNKNNLQMTFYNTANSKLPHNAIRKVIVDQDGSKIVGTDGGFAIIDPDKGETVPKVTAYNTINSKLPNNFIKSLYVDNLGNIYVGNLNGFVRVNKRLMADEAAWQHFNTSNSKLPNNLVSTILALPDGSMWIGTFGGGLARVTGITNWTVYDEKNGLPNNNINALLLVGNDLYIGTDGGGLVKFDGKNFTVYNKTTSKISGEYITSLAIDRQARIWVGTWGDGISVFDGKNWIAYNSSNSGLTDNFVSSLLIDNQGVAWIGTISKGVIKFDGNEWKQINTSNSSLPRNNITAISINEKGAKWLGFDGLGVGNFEQLGLFEGKNIEILSTKNSKIPNDYVKSIVLDFNSYPWIATWGGLAYLKGGKEWRTFNTQNSKMPHNWVTSVTIDAYGNKWAGTMGRGIVQIQDNNLFGDTIWSVFNTSNSKLPNNNVISLAFDKKNNLWIGLQNGLVRVENAELTDPAKVTIYNVNNSGLLDNLVKAIAFDDFNNIWIGTTQGLSKVAVSQINDKNKWTHYNTFNSGLPNNSVTSIFIDYRNNKWITTEGGLAIFNENGVKVKPDPPSYPPMVSAVAEFIEPSQNFMLDALETGWIEIQFFNDGQGKAQDVFAQIQPENQPGLIYRSVYFIGEIPPNSQTKVRIPVTATNKVPTGQYTFNIMFYEAYKFDPKPTFVTFKTRGFAPPDLVLVDQVIEDLNKNGVVEKAEEVKITLKIQNKGKGEARDVKVKVNVGENIFVGDKGEKEFSLGDLDPQQTKDVVIILFSNNRAKDFPVSIDITEKFNKYNKTNIRLPIKFMTVVK